MMSFVTICDGALIIVLIGFNVWNWFLALFGTSSIEFWGSMENVSSFSFLLIKENKYDLSFTHMQDNIFRIFGTYSIVRLLSPSLRSSPFTGLEWSFQMKDEGFDEDGNSYRTQDIELSSSSLKYESEEEEKKGLPSEMSI